jgi:hypothetical protein
MKIKLFFGLVIVGLAGLTVSAFGAEALDVALQAKIDARLKDVQVWAADPVIVNAVKAQNASLPPELAAMTQEKWKDLSKLDPFVRAFDKNEAAAFLKSKKTEVVIRSFLSDAAGLKVAFTAKTLSWSHQGDPKHELPMTGKTWQGALEQDQASGLEQVQVSVPVLDGGKPIGSLVVGLCVSKL